VRVDSVRPAQRLQRRDARRHRQWIAAQCAGLIHRSERREKIHDVRPPAERADRQSAPDDFAKATQVGRDAEPPLRTTPREPKAGHHFVKNQQRAVVRGDLPEKLQVTGLRQIQTGIAGDRFNDDSGNLILVRAERGFHRSGVIEGNHDRVLRECGRHASAVRMSERQRA